MPWVYFKKETGKYNYLYNTLLILTMLTISLVLILLIIPLSFIIPLIPLILAVPAVPAVLAAVFIILGFYLYIRGGIIS